MAGLPIVKMTLYKHGVGFYVRRGQVAEGAVSLSFNKDEMNDVLKSLTAVALDGGQVTGVDYETPEEKARLLARSSIQLSDEASLRDLLRDLRGRPARVTTTAEALAGTVMGVDLPGEREPMTATVLSLYLPAERQVRPVRLGDILALTLLDDRAADDLDYFLETSLAEENKRAVTVRVTPGTADLSLSYIASSPVWRVSYRLVADATDEGTSGLLQGWGLFDNTLDEDLVDVHLTFVAGMPISFIYDLYTPFTPARPVVKEQARAVAGPVAFEETLEAVGFGAPAGKMAMRGLAATAEAPAALGRAAMPQMTAEDLARSTAVAATGQAQGEFFSYVVAAPITVRRGRSAMAPILQAPLKLRKERIYNGAKHPRNPVITLRFANDTGLTLERGPLTVIEAGEYAGEAMLPFTGPEGEITLAYAVDLGITVTEEPGAEHVLSAVNIKDGMLVIQEWDNRWITYRIKNSNPAAVKVTLEHARIGGYERYDTPPPAEQTETLDRHVVDVPGRKSAAFTARQRRLLFRREEVRKQSLAQLAAWLRDKALDQQTYDRLREVLTLYDRIAEHEGALKKNEAARQEILGQQKVIQGNLGALKDTGEEGQLRARYARTLQEQEDRLVELKRDDDRLRATIEEIKGQIETWVKGL